MVGGGSAGGLEAGGVLCRADRARAQAGWRRRRGGCPAQEDSRHHGVDPGGPRDRQSVVEGKRGDLGGRRILKKKKKQDYGGGAQASRLATRRVLAPDPGRAS